MLGTDFPYPQFYPDHTHVAQVDLRPEAIGRRHTVELGLIGEVRATLPALLPRLDAKTDAGFLEEAQAHYRKARQGLDELAQGKPGEAPRYRAIACRRPAPRHVVNGM